MNTNPTEQLSTLALVKAEPGTGVVGTYSDTVIQEYIDDLSQHWLQECGVFSLSTTYNVTEVYDGTGTYKLKLRQEPINSVATVLFGVCVVPQSTTPVMPGWVIDGSGNFLAFRGGWRVPRGVQNVTVTYNAGNSGIPGDIQRYFTRHVALELKRKDSMNLKSQSLTGGGSNTFMNTDELPPDILRCMKNHMRLGF